MELPPCYDIPSLKCEGAKKYIIEYNLGFLHKFIELIYPDKPQLIEIDDKNMHIVETYLVFE
jgi:hypothetical protein